MHCIASFTQKLAKCLGWALSKVITVSQSIRLQSIVRVFDPNKAWFLGWWLQSLVLGIVAISHQCNDLVSPLVKVMHGLSCNLDHHPCTNHRH